MNYFEAYEKLEAEKAADEQRRDRIRLELQADIRQAAREANLAELTDRYTEQAVKFIQANKDKPFFLYMPELWAALPERRSCTTKTL